MIEQELVNYILLAQKHGLSELEIKQNLLNAGWEAPVVEENFAHARAAAEQTSSVSMPGGTGSQPAHPAVVQPSASPLKTVMFSMQSRKQPSAAESDVPPATAAQPLPLAKKSRWPLWLTVALVLLAAAGGAYAYYGLILTNPSQAWNRFSKSPKDTIYNSTFNFTYTDNGQVSSSSPVGAAVGFNLKNLSIGFSGNGYIDLSNPAQPQSESNIQYTFGSDGTTFSTGLQYILLNKVLYLNVGSNPFLDMVSQSFNNGQKITWLKLDLGEAESMGTSTQTAEQTKIYQEMISPQFKNQLTQIWANANIIKADKFLGPQKINGTWTLHYQNSVDKTALKGAINQMVQLIGKTLQGSSEQFTTSDPAEINQIAGALIDKIQITDFETWLGVLDSKLYQVKLTTNAPSLISMINSAQSLVSGFSSDDEKRIADVETVQNALSSYYRDHHAYPDGQNGQPIGLAPKYLGQLPIAPPPGGNCTDFYNTYWYQPAGTKIAGGGAVGYSSFRLTYCLGSTVGFHKGGIGLLTPAGIQDNIDCPSSDPTRCGAGFDENTQTQQQIADYLDKLNFSAQVSAIVSYSDYGKSQNLAAPDGAFDVLSTLKDAQAKSADAKRLADITQLNSALGLYYNDNNSYPKTLQDLTSNYIGTVPTAPAPPGGSCSGQENAYTYKLIDQSHYQLTFCLGGATGAYAAGPHTLSQAGIK